MLKIYNSLTHRKEPFAPQDPRVVKFYVCGPTVYDDAHLGHARAAVSFDVIRRYLEYSGYHVVHVQNFTDVDDKIINRAAELGVSPEELAEKYTRRYVEDMTRLNVLPPTIAPRATETIDVMIDMIGGLLEKGYAYKLDDGEVLFDTSAFPDYGRLANLQEGDGDGEEEEEDTSYTRVDRSGKRNRKDFTLWKPKKPGEPSWPSPWGEGRPGWHIECSAMNLKYLGETIDLHGGGRDLIFPHHTNETAQSEAFTGKHFCRFWLHNGFVQVNKEKMSKSLGNYFRVRDLLKRYSGAVLRLFLVSTLYRRPIEFSEEQLEQAKRNHERLSLAFDVLVQAKVNSKEDGVEAGELDEVVKAARRDFEAAMDDDFNTPKALAALYTFVRHVTGKVNPTTPSESASSLSGAIKFFTEALGVLGVPVGLASGTTVSGEVLPLYEALAKVLGLLLELRREARDAKDYARADEIREKLRACGVELDDRSGGTSWRWKPF
ncbi:MAG: cysteine--tRNA ligase [Promethearchaeota archaeon]